MEFLLIFDCVFFYIFMYFIYYFYLFLKKEKVLTQILKANMVENREIVENR